MIGHNTLGLPFQNKMLIGRKSPEAFIQHWLDAVCSHDAKAITELYLEDGVLLGTLAETIKTGRQEIRSYFDFFVEKKPCGVIQFRLRPTTTSPLLMELTHLMWRVKKSLQDSHSF